MTHLSENDNFGSDSAGPNQSTQYSVLIVDDDPIILSLLSNMLCAIGFHHVEQANGGLPAMQCLNESRYDVVITDLKMPDMDGYALSDWLKKESPDTRVVMMTGCRTSEVDQNMNADLVDCWIFKPFDLDHLRETMSEMLQTDIDNLPLR